MQRKSILNMPIMRLLFRTKIFLRCEDTAVTVTVHFLAMATWKPFTDEVENALITRKMSEMFSWLQVVLAQDKSVATQNTKIEQPSLLLYFLTLAAP